MRPKLEVCVDSLESAKKAIIGGADELEVCSSLIEGGITPSPGLVTEILKLSKVKPVINVMIRCRGGSDYCYNEHEMTTMLSDIEFYKTMGVNRFVFGALMITREIDKVNCARVIEKAHPIPVTFHRAFDICKNPIDAIMTIIDLGFDRVLTSGHQPSAIDDIAVERLKSLKNKYGKDIVIMPGAGITPQNVHVFVSEEFQIIHSSCKKVRIAYYDDDNSTEDLSEIYVTDKATVEEMIAKLNKVIK